MSERKRIYLCLAHLSDEGLEQKYIKEAFDTNWVVPLGPNVNGFEKDLEDFVNQNEKLSKRVVALSAGTAAVHLALIAAGVKAGDEVIVQSFTFCASSHPITYLGAKPVFVDSEKDSWNMDPELMEEAIKDAKVLFGPFDMGNMILSFVEEEGIAIEFNEFKLTEILFFDFVQHVNNVFNSVCRQVMIVHQRR